jgi:hypothetical protein
MNTLAARHAATTKESRKVHGPEYRPPLIIAGTGFLSRIFGGERRTMVTPAAR